MRTLQFLSHQEIFDRAVTHLFTQGKAALRPNESRAYRGYCGGCPLGNFIQPHDYTTAIEGIPVCYVSKPRNQVPAYMGRGVAQLRQALLRARINIYDPPTIELLGCLQNVHDVLAVCEWRERLTSIARQFGLDSKRVRNAA